MKVIAHAGAVGRVPVLAPDVEPLALADRHLGDEGKEVVRHVGRILADRAARMGADRVEVAQRDRAGARVCGAPVAQDLLDHRLRVAVRVERPQRRVLGQRQRPGLP